MSAMTLEALAAYRRLRDDGTVAALLTRMGADPVAVELEAANVAASDATVAEAYVLGLMVGAQANQVVALIVDDLATDPTEPTDRGRGPGRVRPGIRRRG